MKKSDIAEERNSPLLVMFHPDIFPKYLSYLFANLYAVEKTAAAQKIFVSYSRKDGQDHAFRLAGDLRTAGANVWMDQIDIEPGKPWDLEVEHALKTADCVLFVATEKSVASGNVLNEVYYALDENKRILPAVFHDCPFPFQLRRLQRIDFSKDYDAGFSRLLKALGMVQPAGVSVPPAIPNTPVASTKPETPKTEPVKIAPAAVERATIEEPVSPTPLPAATASFNDSPEKKGVSKKPLLWGLGIAAVALLVFVLVKNLSGSGNETANTGDSSRVLGKTEEAKASDSPALSPPQKGETNTGGTTPPNTGNGQVETSSGNTNNAADKQKQFDEYKQAGMSNFTADKYKEAIDDFGKALAIRDDAEAYFYTGRSHGQLKEYPSAIAAYGKAIALAPDKAGYWGSRGIAYRNNGQYAESIADFDKAISLDPNDGQTYNNRGLSKRASGDLTGACTDFQSAAKLGFAQGQTNYNSYCGAKPTSPTGIKVRLDKAKLQNYKRIQAPAEKY